MLWGGSTLRRAWSVACTSANVIVFSVLAVSCAACGPRAAARARLCLRPAQLKRRMVID